MKKELDYFRIGQSYGGCQDWFPDFFMRMGGCAAVAACESCIYFERYRGIKGLYPYESLTKNDYINFSAIMKPYLKPRWTGIDTLEVYIEGFMKYLTDRGNMDIVMEPFYGEQSIENAIKVMKQQIDAGFPIPYLMLHHKNRAFKYYDWHWFMITGYEIFEDTCMVKAVTYGGFRWLDFNELWDTGYSRKGGMIIYRTGELFLWGKGN